MEDPKDVLERFYTALTEERADIIASCYGPEAVFFDPVYGTLREKEVPASWHVKMERRQGTLAVFVESIEVRGERGKAVWRAAYLYRETGRPVAIDIESHFEFRNGKIARHTDYFDFSTWARQALGLSGLLLGWSLLYQASVRRRAKARLSEYLATA